ncbi:MAG: glycosyl hydrolase family 32, partial [Eubacterium sp.]
MITPRYRHHFHLLPPAGWLNDPNGSCWWGDRCHIFFQYAPDSPLGSGSKYWGHY